MAQFTQKGAISQLVIILIIATGLIGTYYLVNYTKTNLKPEAYEDNPPQAIEEAKQESTLDVKVACDIDQESTKIILDVSGRIADLDPTKKDDVLKKAQDELGCDSVETCRSLCDVPANFDKCNELAKSVGIPVGNVFSNEDKNSLIYLYLADLTVLTEYKAVDSTPKEDSFQFKLVNSATSIVGQDPIELKENHLISLMIRQGPPPPPGGTSISDYVMSNYVTSKSTVLRCPQRSYTTPVF